MDHIRRGICESRRVIYDKGYQVFILTPTLFALYRFRSKGLSSGVVEGFNNRVKLTARKAYGFRSLETLKIALFHALGKLPEPESTHRFW